MIDSVHELAAADAAHAALEGPRGAGGKVVVRVRRPWERESVAGMELGGGFGSSNGSKGTPQRAAVPTASVPKRADGVSGGIGLYGSSGAARTPPEKLSVAAAAPATPAVPTLDARVVPPGEAPLPPGWEFAYDPEGSIYYYSHDLNVSQYGRPDVALQSDAALPSGVPFTEDGPAPTDAAAGAGWAGPPAPSAAQRDRGPAGSARGSGRLTGEYAHGAVEADAVGPRPCPLPVSPAPALTVVVKACCVSAVLGETLRFVTRRGWGRWTRRPTA